MAVIDIISEFDIRTLATRAQASLKENGCLGGELGSELGLRHVDLGLSIEEIDIDSSADFLAIGRGVEDVADGLTLGEGVVSDLALLGSTVVGEGNEELAAAEREEAVIDVALDVALVPDLAGLALGVDLGNDLVEVGLRVHVLPEGLAIVGVVSTGVVLLCTVVGEGDTSAGEREDLGLFETIVVATVAGEETSVVVVVNEHAKGIDVLEVARFSIVAVSNVVHRLVRAEDIADSVEHWVVEKSGK